MAMMGMPAMATPPLTAIAATPPAATLDSECSAVVHAAEDVLAQLYSKNSLLSLASSWTHQNLRQLAAVRPNVRFKFGSRSAPPKLNPAKPPFSLLTWNTWFENLAFEERMLRILAYIQKAAPDVVCLQEMTVSSLATFQASTFIQKNYWVVTEKTHPVFHFLVTLVHRKRYAVVNAWKVPFDSVQQRHILVVDIVARLKSSIIQVRIGNVHLESPTGNTKTAKFTDTCRHNQIRVSKAILYSGIINDNNNLIPKNKQQQQQQQLIFLCGDTNADPASNTDAVFDEEGFRDMWEYYKHTVVASSGSSISSGASGSSAGGGKGYTFGVTYPTKNAHLRSRLDRILALPYSKENDVLDNARAQITLLGKKKFNFHGTTQYPSDHLGVLFTINRLF